MRLGIYLTGAFGPSQELYKARNEAKRGRGSEEAVAQQILHDTATIIDHQKEAGVDYLIDPRFNQYYLFQSFTENIPGVTGGPQENWFNNNVFYWRPQIHGPLTSFTPGFTCPSLHRPVLPADGTAMAILPSPYTLLMLSDVTGYQNQRSAITDLAQLLHHEAQHLVTKHKVGRIQYDEPAMVVKQSWGSLTKEDFDLLSLSLEYCGTIPDATTSLHTYFGDAGPILDYFLTLPVDCLGIDGTETSVESIARHKFGPKELAVGLLDARNPALENCRDLVSTLQLLSSSCRPQRLWLTPTTGTEYIGWTLGLEKLKLLEQVRRQFPP